MPPPLALGFTLAFIGILLVRDTRAEPRVSGAVWIPTIWLMIIGSRSVSLWLFPDSGFDVGRLEDGSAIDKVVYGVLMIVALVILARRRVRVSTVVSNNVWVSLFVLYEGLSVLWSDYPLIAFKRWSKALGDPLMVLVLCTDPFPQRAVAAVLKRSAYVLIPVSVLFCKYYEHLGRAIDLWGRSYYTGVTTDKNMLGYLLFAFGLFFVTCSMSRAATGDSGAKVRVLDRAVSLLLLAMTGWLALLADSQTAVVALLIGALVASATLLGPIRRHFWVCLVAAIVLGTALEASFSVSAQILESVERDTSFTGRTGLWETLLREPVNPLVGVGYASFWLGARLARFWAMYKTSPPIQAHNGYLEVYLNLGLIGLCLLAGVLWAGLQRARVRLASPSVPTDKSQDSVIRVFGIAYAVGYLVYNFTEATFQGLNPLFFVFMCLAMEYRPTRESFRRVSGAATVAQHSWQPTAGGAARSMRGAR